LAEASTLGSVSSGGRVYDISPLALMKELFK